MSNFWDGFEKQAILWDKTKDVKKFTDLALRLAQQRAKNMGITISDSLPVPVLFKLLEKLSPNRFGGMADIMKEISKSKGSAHAFGKTITIPENLAGVGRNMSNKAKAVIMQHELDEVDMARKVNWGAVKNYLSKEVDLIKAWGRSAKARSLSPVLEHAATPRNIHPKGYAGSHMSPAVVLRESNRVFSGVPPEVKKDMIALRASSGEIADVKRHGLRYGEENVPEGGKRWNKLMSKLEGTIPGYTKG